MARNIRLLLYCISVFLLINCSTLFRGEDEKKNTQLEYPAELEDAQDLFVKDKPVDAINKINHFLNDAQKIHWFGHAYFLKAYIFEATGDSTKAIQFYREAIDHGVQYEREVEAKALYNLSFVYEKDSELQKMLVTLIDLMKRKKYFTPFIAQVETPARLAGAYASMGRLKLAIGLHEEAANNYSKLIRKNFVPKSRELHSKILFYLGFSSFDQNNESFDSLFKKLQKGQKYFLYGVEASKGVWADKCRTRLENQYGKAWGMILDYEPEGFANDNLAFKRNKEEVQLDRASDLYDLMFQLRAEDFPLDYVNRNSAKMMSMTQEWIDKIEKFTLGLDLGPAMVRNKKIKNRRLVRYTEKKQEAIVVNKESAAEKSKIETPSKDSENQEGQNLPEKKMTPVEKKSIGQDPNL